MPERKSDVRAGVALAITAFMISMFLYFQPRYFGSLTTAVAIALIALGLMGLGIQLDRIVSKTSNFVINREERPKIFDNLGIGLGLFTIWATVYYYFPITWVNILISAILFFGVYGITQGLVNILFVALTKSDNETSLSHNEPSYPRALAVKIAVAISGIIGFIASILQILQFLKVIP